MQKGSRFGAASVVVQARRRAPTGPARMGFTATKKIGGAVVRNRARRRLRDIARRLLPLHGVEGVDYVFIARDTTAEAPWRRLVDDVENALIRLRRTLVAADASPHAPTASSPLASSPLAPNPTAIRPEET